MYAEKIAGLIKEYKYVDSYKFKTRYFKLLMKMYKLTHYPIQSKYLTDIIRKELIDLQEYRKKQEKQTRLEDG